MDSCEYAPYANLYGTCRGQVAPRDAIHVLDGPPVPCARLCDKHAVNLRAGYHGDLDTRELRCERKGQGACAEAPAFRDEVRVGSVHYPTLPLCGRHWERELEDRAGRDFSSAGPDRVD